MRELADSALCCMTWGPDGFIYYSTNPGTASFNAINRVSAAGGAVEAVTQREPDDGRQGYFQMLAGGETGLFTQWDLGRDLTAHIEAIRLATGERRVLTPGIKPYVTSTGHLVFASQEGQILAAPFDADALELTGPALPLVDGVFLNPAVHPFYSLSDNGTMVYRRSAAASDEVEFVWVTRSGEMTSVDQGERFNPPFGRPSFRLSPEGGRVAYSAAVDGNADIWIKDLSGGAPLRLTFGDETDENPDWSPDGESIVHLAASDIAGTGVVVTASDRALWSRRVDGTGVAERLVTGVSRGTWSPSAEWLVVYRGTLSGESPGMRDILALRPGADTVPSALIASDQFEEISPAISRDGRWLAYTSNETGQREVFVRPFRNVDGGKWQISTNGGTQPVWAHNGRELFFYDGPARELKAVEFTTTGTTFRRGEITTLFSVGQEYRVDQLGMFYDVEPHDQRFLMVRGDGPQGDNSSAVVLVQNWFEELKNLAGP
jgi:serine/threonine-protein kinase